MAAYSQSERSLKISTPLGKDVLLLAGLHGREGLSQLFRFTLELATAGEPVAFDKVLGQPVSVAHSLPDNVERYYHGIVSRLRQTCRDKDFVYYEADIMPRMWLLTKSQHSRIFQRLRVPDILKEVFEDLRPDVQFRLSGSYPSREYCVQYRESDFAFASRLMEEEGIYYFFEHAADSHTLVITDDVQGCSSLTDQATVVFDDLQPFGIDRLRVTAWAKEQTLTTRKFSLWDRHFELPEQNLEATADIAETVTAGSVDHQVRLTGQEHQDYPGGYANWFDGVGPDGQDQTKNLGAIQTENRRMVRLRAEAETAQALTIEAASNCGHFSAGRRFQLDGHFDGNGEYLITQVDHEVKASYEFRSTGQPQPLTYSNRLHCLPATVAYRPERRAPRPRIAGTQTAKVVGMSGDDICLDKYGRVKVQFYWDRQGQNDARSSCWLRVGQVWAGKGWGAFFWPRVGHEVIVSFEEGNPDRPLVVGSVYNADNLPPLELPANSYSGGIKSCTLGGDPQEHFSCLVFHDQQGKEFLELHSENEEQISCESGRYHVVPGPNVQVSGASLMDLAASAGSGSGGGMLFATTPLGLFGSKSALAAADVIAKLLPGSYSNVAGDLVGATVYGNTYFHYMCGVYNFQIQPLRAIPGLGTSMLASALISDFSDFTALSFGSCSTLNYLGPNTSVTRAENIDLTESAFGSSTRTYGSGVASAVQALSLLITAGILAGHTAIRITAGDAPESPPPSSYLFLRLHDIAVSMLNALEFYYARVVKAVEVLKEGEQNTENAIHALNKMIVSKERITDAIVLAFGAVTSLARPVATLATVDSNESDAKSELVPGDYTLTAKTVTIGNRSDAATKASLEINDSGNAIVKAGSVLLDIGLNDGSFSMNKGGTSIDAGANGTLSLRAASSANFLGSPCVAIASQGVAGSIDLAAGNSINQASISLDQSGLTLAFGPLGAAASIALSLTGITLTYSGAGIPQTVKLSPTGLELNGTNIDIKAMLQLTQKAVIATESISATKSTSATLTQV